MTLYRVLNLCCMLGALAALFYQLPVLLRNRKDPSVIAISVYFSCSALSFFLGVMPISDHVARALGHDNISIILIHSHVIALTVAQQVVLVYWSYPPAEARFKTHKRLAAFGLMLLILIVLFYGVPPSRIQTAETISQAGTNESRYVTYLCAYTAVVTVGQLITMRLSLHYASIATRAWLRRGMRMVAAGAALILVYCVMWYAEVVGVQFGADMRPWDPVQWITDDAGSLLELMGWTIPGWGPRVFTGHRWLGNYNAYRRLHPLWIALYRASPTIAMSRPRSRLEDLIPWRQLEHKLYRRVIEILDGQLALRPYFHPDDAEAAWRRASDGELDSTQRQITAQAIQLHAALRAKAKELPSPLDPPATLYKNVGDDLSSQIRWLVQLANAFACEAAPDETVSARSQSPPLRA